MRVSIEQFLEQVARRGSCWGGGSVTAFNASLSAALLEKLLPLGPAARRLRRIRRGCLALIERDARAFAGVMRATRAGDRMVFRRSLKTATEIPCRVYEHAQILRALCRNARRRVRPRFRSDLRCAAAIASATDRSARALIQANLAWLRDRGYAERIHRRLKAAARPRSR